MLRSAARRVARRVVRPGRDVLARVVRAVAPGIVDRRTDALRREAMELRAQIEDLEGEIAVVLDTLAATAEAIAAQRVRE